MPNKMLEFTIAGLIHNLDTLRDLLNGVVTCYDTEGLDEFGATLTNVAIFIVGKTRERALTALTKEDT